MGWPWLELFEMNDGIGPTEGEGPKQLLQDRAQPLVARRWPRAVLSVRGSVTRRWTRRILVIRIMMRVLKGVRLDVDKEMVAQVGELWRWRIMTTANILGPNRRERAILGVFVGSKTGRATISGPRPEEGWLAAAVTQTPKTSSPLRQQEGR